MKRQRLFAILGLIALISAMSIATGEDIVLGPAEISIDLSGLGSCEIVDGDTYSMDHEKPRFQYQISSAAIKVDGSERVQLEVHEMSTSEPLEDSISARDDSSGLEHCISRSDMIQGLSGEKLQPEAYTIAGKDGVLATIDDTSSGNTLYIAAYSPDQTDGSGSIVCIVGSDLPWETTEKIFASISTKVQ